MSTTYYVVHKPSNICQCCDTVLEDREDTEIAHESGGWKFTLYNVEGKVDSLDDLLEWVGEREIVDDYSQVFTHKEFSDRVLDVDQCRSSHQDTPLKMGIDSWMRRYSDRGSYVIFYSV